MKDFCYITYFHPFLSQRDDLRNLDDLFIACSDTRQFSTLDIKSHYYSLFGTTSSALNSLFSYVKKKYYWAVVFHPRVKVNAIPELPRPFYYRFYFSSGLDWRNEIVPFNGLHFAFIARTLDFFCWNNLKEDSLAMQYFLFCLQGLFSRQKKKLDPFWRVL